MGKGKGGRSRWTGSTGDGNSRVVLYLELDRVTANCAQQCSVVPVGVGPVSRVLNALQLLSGRDKRPGQRSLGQVGGTYMRNRQEAG
jgi:hypothetical protein